MNVPLRTTQNLPLAVIILDVKPMAGSITAMPLPLALFGFLDCCFPVFGCAAEDGEEYLHVGMVGIVVGGPLAVYDAGEGGLVGTFFQFERHDERIFGKIGT